jgi:aminoglycoside phosphotransferase (APT) family kinase protein
MPTKVKIVAEMLRVLDAEVPLTLKQAVDGRWLYPALSHLSNGSRIRSISVQDVVKAMASKVRITVSFEDNPDQEYCLCLKGFLDHDLSARYGGITTLREAGFYCEIAPYLDMEVPPCVAVVRDIKNQRCIIIMADMIDEGAHFYNALEPFTVDQVAETLDQLARLHARPELLEGKSWIPSRLDEIATRDPVYPWEKIQELMRDSRAGDLPDRTTDANYLKRGMEELATLRRSQPKTVLHGDCHPGNVYRKRSGELGFTDWQLVQRGHWELDVAYHIPSSLPLALAEREERNLLNHYLDSLYRYSGTTISRETAWEDYRRAPVYGYYHWAITQRVDPEITHQAFYRLGAAVTRHDSYKLLGLA